MRVHGYTFGMQKIELIDETEPKNVAPNPDSVRYSGGETTFWTPWRRIVAGALTSALVIIAVTDEAEPESPPQLAPTTTQFEKTPTVTTIINRLPTLPRSPDRPELYRSGEQLDGYKFQKLESPYTNTFAGITCEWVAELAINEGSITEQLEAVRLDWQAYPQELPGGQYDSIPFLDHMYMLEYINYDEPTGFKGNPDVIDWRSDTVLIPFCTTL